MTSGPEDAVLLEAAIDALYAVDPTRFTDLRTALVRSLRAAGQTDDAVRVKSLGKPSRAAWALNLLVREDRVEVDAVLAIGDELRRAQRTLSAEDLRSLTQQRHQIVRAVARRAAELAVAADHPLSPSVMDQVARSLDAALSDPVAAGALVEGRLVTALEYAGLGEEAPTTQPTLTIVGGTAAAGDAHPSAKAAHRAAVRAAERAAKDAETELTGAADRLARARAAAAAANLRVASAEETLATAQAELATATHAEETAEGAVALANKTHDRATDRALAAQQTLASLRQE